MNGENRKRVGVLVSGAAVLLAFGGGVGYWVARHSGGSAKPAPSLSSKASVRVAQDRQALYWYDPMVPNQHFAKPGKSPFMDMQLLPRYAEDSGQDPGIRLDSDMVQKLGVRLTPVLRATLPQAVDAVGSITFNQRDIAIVQARTSGFVTRVYARAPGDVVGRDAPLVDLLVPEWAGAQTEFLVLLRSADAALIDAARQRLMLVGMPMELIAAVEASGRLRSIVTVRSPLAGVIESLEIRAAMTVTAGTTIARINGLDTVWLEAAVPEMQAALVTVDQQVQARLTAYPAEVFMGRVIAVLPQADIQTRTVRVRIELANPQGRLRPGMFAQVRLASVSPTPVLYVASEAVIHTGTRAVVIVAGKAGRFIPTEVQAGLEADGNTTVLGGLTAGQMVVASGQFLIDSEASLKGVLARLGGDPASGPGR